MAAAFLQSFCQIHNTTKCMLSDVSRDSKVVLLNIFAFVYDEHTYSTRHQMTSDTDTLTGTVNINSDCTLWLLTTDYRSTR